MPWKSSFGNSTVPKGSRNTWAQRWCCHCALLRFSLLPLCQLRQMFKKNNRRLLHWSGFNRQNHIISRIFALWYSLRRAFQPERKQTIWLGQRGGEKRGGSVSTSYKWRKKNSNMVQCSGMFTDVESARLLLVMRYCSVTAWSSRRVLWGGGGNCAASLSLRRWRSRLRPLPLAEAFGSSAPEKCPFWLAAVSCRCKRRRSSTLGGGGSQRSSERFWMTSATTVRRRAMTERGSSLPITALPDTIMLAPAWGRSALGEN